MKTIKYSQLHNACDSAREKFLQEFPDGEAPADMDTFWRMGIEHLPWVLHTLLSQDQQDEYLRRVIRTPHSWKNGPNMCPACVANARLIVEIYNREPVQGL